MLLYLILGYGNWSNIVLIVSTYGLGLINHLVFLARGRIITPQDFFAVPTVWRVLKSYKPVFSMQLLISTFIGLMFLAAIGIALNSKNPSRRDPRIVFGFLLIILIGFGSFFLTPLPDRLGLQDKLWDSMWNAKSSGALLDFMVNLRYSRISKPDGYSDEKATEIMNQNEVGFSDNRPMDFFYTPECVEGSEQKPHLIVIMNESFSDLSVLGDVSYSQNPLPFFESLKSDSMVHGEVIVPVLGGHTANTEFEFLTGQSCAFLPEQTVPYQLYVKDHHYSLPQYLNGLGYTSIAFHPGAPESWNRQTVYEKMAFDYQYFEEDVQNPEYIRTYLSDQSNYQNLIRFFEQHRKEGPLFVFNVTIQNHGGYDLPWSHLDRSVQLHNQGTGTPLDHVDQYLSLLKKSDDALCHLIAYFDAGKEPVVVLFFGDHQPYLGESFYKMVMDEPSSVIPPAKRVELQENQLVSPSIRTYRVPFLIWTNMHSQKASDVRITPNFLQILLLKSARIPMSGYQLFLEQVMQEVPIVHSAWKNQTDEPAVLKKYEYIQYDSLR